MPSWWSSIKTHIFGAKPAATISVARRAYIERREQKKKRENHKISGREWVIGLGLPAGAYFAGIGMTMDQPHLYFGLWIMLLCAVLLPLDWIYINRYESTSRRLVALPILVIGLLYPAWIWFWPYPITIAISAPRDNYYAPGTSVLGIDWKPYYSKMVVGIGNNTDNTYHNIRASIESDEWIANAAMQNDTNHCSIEPGTGNGMATITSSSPKLTTPMNYGASTNYVLTCETIAPHSSEGILLAVEPDPLAAVTMPSRQAPRWALVDMSWEGGNRVRGRGFMQCLQTTPCPTTRQFSSGKIYVLSKPK